MALFRAQKRSTFAKRYRRGKFRRSAYDVKNWSMGQACCALESYAKALGIRWGWKRDANTTGYEWVLYVDLPTGQVSFHSPARLFGPDYPGDWDGARESANRVIAFTQSVIDSRPGLPSAADLDAVADEQKQRERTNGAGA